MRGFAEVAGQVCGQSEAKPFLERISVAAERMDALIRDALNLQPDGATGAAAGGRGCGCALARNSGFLPGFPAVQGKYPGGGVAARGPGERGRADAVFSNLLGNAVKFVRAGEVPEIRVRAEQQSGWARIWVEDKGIGIAKEMLPRVFDMFSRASKDYEGTGIGLALVRKVVQRMGGRVGVESEEGKGSRFWIELKSGEVRPRRGEVTGGGGGAEGRDSIIRGGRGG